MSQENVERVRRMLEAFNSGDHGAALSLLAEEVEWHAPANLTIGGEIYRGRAEVVEGLTGWLDAWEEYRFDPTELLGHEDKVMVAGTHSGRGRGSGVQVDQPTYHVYTLRDGKITCMRNFSDRGQALAAVGLTSP
jgi:ketosteroid isomerase-like protein